MVANVNPVFVLTPNAFDVIVSVANANLTFLGAFGTVYSAGILGGRVEYVHVKAQQTTTQGMIRLWIFDPGSGNQYLWKEIPVTAVTPSGSVKAFEATFIPKVPLVLPNNWSLVASTEKGETFRVTAFGGDF